jgi:hypothetical protein
MAKVFGGGSSAGSCGGNGGILPSQKQQVVPARSVVSTPNVFKSGAGRTDDFDPRDFYTRREVDRYLDDKANISDVYDKSLLYTKTEVDNKIYGLNLSSYALESYVDEQIESRALQIETNLASNYYQRTQLYTRSEVDVLISSAASTNYISKAPSDIDEVTITPQVSSLSISLLVKSANNLASTEVQRWENASTDHLASIFADGKAMFSNYVSIGENVNSDGVALNTNSRRIAGVADPVNNLDAVNKTYMERFITTTIDDVLTDSDENYLIDALEY